MTRGGGARPRPSWRRPRRSRQKRDSAVPGGRAQTGGPGRAGRLQPPSGEVARSEEFPAPTCGLFPGVSISKRRPKGAELVLSAEDGIPAVPGRGRGCCSRGDPKMRNRLLTKMPPPPKLCGLGTGSERLPRPPRPDPSLPRLSRKPSLGPGEVGGTAGFY